MIKTWKQRCEEHPDHEGIVSESMIRARMQEEIDELRQALAMEEQTSLEYCDRCGWKAIAPPEGCLICDRKKWVGLTEEEGAEIWGDAHDIDRNRLVTPQEIIRRIEAKLKEKNGG